MIAVVEQPIDVGAVLEAVEGPGEGAAVLFVGRVRDHTGDKTVTHLEYECYAEMALAEMSALVDEARDRHGALKVALVHRVGRLQIGEAAVAIAVGSGHRPEAFAACRWLIDTLKQRVPIWKQEWDDQGGSWISERP